MDYDDDYVPEFGYAPGCWDGHSATAADWLDMLRVAAGWLRGLVRRAAR